MNLSDQRTEIRAKPMVAGIRNMGKQVTPKIRTSIYFALASPQPMPLIAEKVREHLRISDELV